MAEGVAVSTDDFSAVCITNDVGGTSMLPPGRYRVEVVRQWHDYETGIRMVGELLDEADWEVARLAGTTGYATDGVLYAPITVYFAGSQFEDD
jgi:hypothetical protein